MKTFKMFKLRFKNLVNNCKSISNHNIRNEAVRVRFAPSPTGYLHLGGLRTALYNYLFAKKHYGKFILRIEDTDQTRLVNGASEQIYHDLIWSGIEIDEGPNVGGLFGPYIQSDRIDLYRDQIKTLIDNDSAYYCFCTNKRLELIRKEAVRIRQTPKYDNRCRHLSKSEILNKLKNGDKYCIRFKLLSGSHNFYDMVYGNVSYDITLTEGDPIIMKSDGYPTYHFANVVDDHLMQISHVLRGVEWQISTTKHIMMYRAFNWTPPSYGHLPLLINADGTKLSKRQGDIHISHFRDSGIFPQALINFIVNSGGGFEKDLVQNVKPKSYTIEDLTKQFVVSKVNVSSGKLMFDRLSEFNRIELSRLLEDPEQEMLLVKQLKTLIQQSIPQRSDTVVLTDTAYVREILSWALNRINYLSDLVSKDFMFLWVMPKYKEVLKLEQVEVLSKANQVLNDGKFVWSKENIDRSLREVAEEHNFSYSGLMKLLRSLLSGLKEGPSVGEMIQILGKDNTITRLQMCLEKNNHNLR